ncbi:MAG: leucine-rich repeat protein [Lachnospira sp.]|nr:leucine-rich repeat protein [Lachnospira sp.]
MNRYFMRKIALLLAIILTFSTVGVHLNVTNADAAVSGEFSYVISGGAISITGYGGSSANVVIPSTIDGYAVSKINDRAFAGNTTITSVTLPKQAIEIGSGAFNLCSSLVNVYNSEYAVIIYTGAFAGCTSLSSFKFSPNLTALGDSTFRNTALTEVYLPKSVNSLRQYTFANCSSLKHIYIASSTLIYQDNTIFDSSPVTLHAPAGSTTQTFAATKGITFVEYTPPADEDETESETGSSGGGNEDESETGSTGNSGDENCNHEYLLDAANSTIYYCMEYLAFKCAFCDASYMEVVEYEEDHEFGDWVIDKEATATEEGEKSKYCGVCGKRTDITSIPKVSGCAEHNYVITNTKVATCQSIGVETYTCSNCGDTYNKTLAKINCDYGDWIVDKEATYTSSGSKSQYCIMCNDRVTATIPKLECTNHDYQFTKVVTPATCTSTGTNLETCSICKISTREITTSVIAHSYGDFVIDTAATYTSTGVKSKYCSVCNHRTEITTIPMLTCTNHNYEYTRTTTKATCINTGVDLYTCTICSATTNKTTPTIDHIYGDFVIDKKATYTEFGEKSKYCTMCNKRTEITEIPKLVCSSHNYTYTKTTKEATCTQTGVAIHTCTVCTTTKEVAIPIKDHSYGDWVIDKEATYSETGEKSKHCSVCGARTEITEIPKLVDTDHTYVFSKTITTATCTTTGKDLYVCTREGCGSTIEIVTAKTAHTYGDWVVDKKATYHETGEKSKYCTECGNRTEITSIPMLVCTHNYQYTSTITAPTCQQTGTALHTCSVSGCGATKYVTLDKIAHNYGDWVIDKEATTTEAGQKSKHCSMCDARTEITEIPMLESKPVISGDCDGDNKISITDAVAVKKLLAGIDENINESAADVNKDGMVDLKDAVMLMKHLAGINVGLGDN